MNIKRFTGLLVLAALISCNSRPAGDKVASISISQNGRYLQDDKGEPFFWLADTGWLLFTRLDREEAVKYLDIRKQQGFNVIQAVAIHSTDNSVNVYGDSAISHHRIDFPVTTAGSSFASADQYDYWDHVDFIVREAEKRGIYIAMVPVWGSNVRAGRVNSVQAATYTRWLAGRYGAHSNIIWINGGDVRGSDSTEVWNTIGAILAEASPGHLVTFHPFGRTQSSMWFQDSPWLDFNMFQSGHRRYDQDTTGLAYGEDNWRYMEADYAQKPVKPSLDGEPSYESIPQGLHDSAQPRWTDADVRRYAYWSVFAGACGHSYGHNAVMQFNKPGNPSPAYGVREYWDEALVAAGASQMQLLKKLLLSRSYFDRIPAQDMLALPDGKRYDHIAVTKGNDYLFAYTCNGRNIEINSVKLGWERFRASWFDPRSAHLTAIGTFNATGVNSFDPPGEPATGNDWVLVLDRL